MDNENCHSKIIPQYSEYYILYYFFGMIIEN